LTFNSIVVCSPVIGVSVGTEGKIVAVPKELLTMYSDYFRNIYFPTNNLPLDTEIQLHMISPHQVANFIIWLHSGVVDNEISPEVMPEDRSVTLADEYEGLWIVGEMLQAKAFQNYCMKKILQYGEGKSHWPTPEVAASHTRTPARIPPSANLSLTYSEDTTQ
jgi:hypothetical protein